MSRKEIIEMAEEAGLPINTGPSGRPGFKALWGPELERFAALVEAKERDACAQVAAQTVCDTHIPTGINIYGTRAAKAIRARSTT